MVKLYSKETQDLLGSNERKAMLLIHGLLDSSDGWIVNTKENAIGLILADEGYDVWMANTRGNKYSYKHTTLDSKKDWEYWDHAISTDIAKYDLPAFMEYVKVNSNV